MTTNVDVELDYATAVLIDRLICYMLHKVGTDDPVLHTALVDTHHALADGIINKSCTHCGIKPTRRRSRLCDACNTYHRKYNRLPGHSLLDKREGEPS